MDENLIEGLYQYYKRNPSISTDSRNVKPDDIFFALKGPNFNANEFAFKAIENGAAIAVIDNPEFKIDDRYWLVEDSLLALQSLANLNRKQFDIPVIAITGSNGKTTTRELIVSVLRKKYQVHSTQGNLNNNIGVPLTLLKMPPETEIAIIEMGANHLGEINNLCNISEPNYGLITNIGKAHTEGFGNFEGVVRGKSELYQYLIEKKGKVFINSREQILVNMGKRFHDPVLYGSEGDFFFAELIEANPYLTIGVDNEKIKTHLIGKYNFDNVITAMAIGQYFQVEASDMREAIASNKPSNNRSQVLEINTNTIILDAYNANPSSMQVALDNFSVLDGEKVVILGDMNELGEISQSEHENLVKETLSGYSKVYLVGPLIKEVALINSKAHWFNSVDELKDELEKNPIQNCKILIKASRSIGLERVIDAFTSENEA